jgi:hypothetical protein
MLGRKTYTQQELDNARAAIEGQLEAYRALVEAAADPEVRATLDHFEPLLANSMTLTLDR